MKYPVTISHYKLTAKIYKGGDGCHAVWNAGGKRVKATVKKAKGCKDRGHGSPEANPQRAR